MVQLIVYAGAVVVLFVFIIALLSPGAEERVHIDSRFVIGAVVALGIGITVAMVVAARHGITFDGNNVFRAQQIGQASDPYHSFSFEQSDLGLVNTAGNVQTVGGQLFTTFLLPFEITSLLLLVAAVGAVYLTRRTASTPNPSFENEHWPVGHRQLSKRTASRSRWDERGRQLPLPARPRRFSFSIGALGVLIRRNPIVVCMCIELMLNAVNIVFVSYVRFLNSEEGQVIAVSTARRDQFSPTCSAISRASRRTASTAASRGSSQASAQASSASPGNIPKSSATAWSWFASHRRQSAEQFRAQRALEQRRKKAGDSLREAGGRLAPDVLARLNRTLRSAGTGEEIDAVAAEVELSMAARNHAERRRDREIDRTRSRIRKTLPRAAAAEPAETWQDVLRRFAESQSAE